MDTGVAALLFGGSVGLVVWGLELMRAVVLRRGNNGGGNGFSKKGVDELRAALHNIESNTGKTVERLDGLVRMVEREGDAVSLLAQTMAKHCNDLESHAREVHDFVLFARDRLVTPPPPQSGG